MTLIARRCCISVSRHFSTICSLVGIFCCLDLVNAEELAIGIPKPPFGLTDSHEVYAGIERYVAGPSGPYTHYVDNTESNCRDWGNGSQARPRCTIPTKLSAGDVVEIHGGPYATSTHWFIDAKGTRAQPIFIRGIDDGKGRPVFDSNDDNGKVFLDGSYAILENLELNTTGLRLGYRSLSAYLGVRNVAVGFHEKTCVIVQSNYSVVSGSEFHHCQDPTKDRHGAQINAGTKFIWLLNNYVHHNSGNGIQYTHGAQLDPPDFIFIAGNHLHSDREVGIATKWVGRTVISSNIIHNYQSSSVGEKWCFDDGSACMKPESATNGPGIIVGADGYPKEQWVIYNLIYNSAHCIRIETGEKVRIVGNVCANIEGTGISLEKWVTDLFIVNNTFYRTGWKLRDAVFQQNWRDNFDPEIHNNIILNPGGPVFWFKSRSVLTKTKFKNNLIWNAPGKVEFRIKNNTRVISSTAELSRLLELEIGESAGNLVANPAMAVHSMTRPAWGDFQPAVDSVASGAGSEILVTLNEEFERQFGSEVTVLPCSWSFGVIDIGAVPVNDSINHGC